MILKSLSRKSGSQQLLNYLFEKKEKTSDKGQKPLVIKHNVRSRTLENWGKEFEQNESLRLRVRKDSVKMYHTILSFSNKDKNAINEKVLKDIAKKFIELRGRDSMYIVTAHHNREHIHLHIASSGTKYLTGESNRISKQEFLKLKTSLDSYQKEKYPELIHSLPSHGKELQTGKQDSRMSQKQTLLEILQNTFASSKSTEQFLSALKAQGHEPYYRGGKITGVKYDGDRKFRLNRLGYDKEKLEQFDRAQTKEKESLQELKDIRERSSDEKEKITERSDNNRESDNDERSDIER